MMPRESDILRMRLAKRIKAALIKKADYWGLDLHEYVRMTLSKDALEPINQAEEEEPTSYDGFRPLGA